MMPRIVILAGALLLGLGGTAAQQSEATRLRAFRKEFVSTKKRPKSASYRLEALRHLEGLDSPKVAQTLVRAFVAVETDVITVLEPYTERAAAIEKILRDAGAEFEPRPLLDSRIHQRLGELRKTQAEERARLDGLRALQSGIADRLRKLRKRESVTWLLSHVVGDAKRSLPLKIVVAGAVGQRQAGMLTEVKAALARAHKPNDLMALLLAIRTMGTLARPLGPDLAKYVTHKNAEVRERAAAAVAAIHYFAAIPAVIDALAKASGRAQRHIGLALEDMTGQKLGSTVVSWRGWWEREGKAFVAGGGKSRRRRRAGGMFAPVSQERRDATGEYYFGLPNEGTSVLYIIDASGSMKQPVTWASRPGGGGITVAAGAEKKKGAWAKTRLEACKRELVRALGQLRRNQTFNVIWFSELAHRWRPKMQAALPSLIADARAWVERLQPLGTTNIHDALQLGFSMVKGRGIYDRAYRGAFGLDTVFLLTDGSPTLPSGKLDDTEKILRAVRHWNPLKRVTIHTIAIGSENLDVRFLKRLAAENGGVFQHYTDSGKKRR